MINGNECDGWQGPARRKGRLPSFRDFRAAMEGLPQLLGVDPKQRRRVLKRIFRIAERKVALEEGAEFSRNRVQPLRTERNRMSRARNFVENALQALELTRAEIPALEHSVTYEPLKSGEENGPLSPAEITLEQVISYLKNLCEWLGERETIAAATIHPGLRSRAERLDAEKHFSRAWHMIEPSGYPAISEKTPDIAHWFIGEVASILQEIESDTATQIRNKQTFIARVFDSAFGELRTDESIRKELDRQKRQGKPNYGFPVWIQDPPYWK